MFGGAVSWMLDAATRRALNSWSSDKTAIITGRSRKEENKRRTLNAALNYDLNYEVPTLLGEGG
eukprot:COSAG02_NODE_1998_length_10148_cov_30.517663_13_plen_64_part_00